MSSVDVLDSGYVSSDIIRQLGSKFIVQYFLLHKTRWYLILKYDIWNDVWLWIHAYSAYHTQVRGLC